MKDRIWVPFFWGAKPMSGRHIISHHACLIKSCPQAVSRSPWLQALHFLPPQSDSAVYGAAAYACQESGEWRETVRLLQILRDSWLCWLCPMCPGARNNNCSSRNFWTPRHADHWLNFWTLQHSQPKLWSLSPNTFSVVGTSSIPKKTSLPPGRNSAGRNSISGLLSLAATDHRSRSSAAIASPSIPSSVAGRQRMQIGGDPINMLRQRRLTLTMTLSSDIAFGKITHLQRPLSHVKL